MICKFIGMVTLNQGIAGLGGNSALILTVAAHLDVSVKSPGWTPRVLDKPVVLTAFATVADGQNTVIQFFATASSFIVDTYNA